MNNNKRIAWAIGLGAVVLVVGSLLVASITTVKQGHVGVVFSKNGGVIQETLHSGWHLKNPLHEVTQYPVSLDSVSYAGMELTTKDGKPLKMDVEYDYQNDLQKVPHIFDTWKGQKPSDIEDNFLRSRAKESAMSVTSRYTILEIFQNYEKIKDEIGNSFAENVKPHGFMIENFVLGAPTPDESTKKAIQAVVDAQQQLEALKIEKQKASEVAEKQKIEAEGKAAAAIAEAKGEAEANRLMQQSITPELLKKMEMEARMKHGWVEINGAGAVVTK
ncbi:prohibitin family protein [Paenibacillus alvei]|uniref:prohibitin family protein n=1 Tax=Paenibacillus alvei TaxID=44250 RepID=UPI00227F011C|nr:prohibitin family protein [Paenibacillus alvei]MCY9757682.1 prohibitin family protein [Paenibacillus alvei]